MKIVLFLVLCAVAYTVAEPDGQCPEEEDPLQPAIYYPDTDDCFIFYECSNGVALQLYCSPGTYFDDTNNICATHVRCGDKNTTPKGYTTPRTTIEPEDNTTPEEVTTPEEITTPEEDVTPEPTEIAPTES